MLHKRPWVLALSAQLDQPLLDAIVHAHEREEPGA